MWISKSFYNNDIYLVHPTYIIFQLVILEKWSFLYFFYSILSVYLMDYLKTL